MPVIIKGITFDEVRYSNPAKIYYGARTCWWTHDPAHLSKLASGLPCDPHGGVLYELSDVQAFLRTAEDNETAYGLWGLDAFMAAHHQNCVVNPAECPIRHTCFAKWDEYNAALDRSGLIQGDLL